ncbi:D-alanyl-D-alanine carboxypeptidase family protein [Paenibacillus alkalitolerans]|uniref:D-alanyl-D-alanine carboxypeptidase family protein n=1 Tax=Paenibacillus alkalitolerans TaxID=2799335 RepID=UPI0018F29B63|nr:D-alanyl-D-alanine carboxypeptidase family protein [Paenibacillus alkalitolerans]
MSKKTRVIALALLSLLIALFAAAPVAGAVAPKPQAGETGAEKQVDLAPNARSAILVDADTGTVIYEKNKTEHLPPASITKIMLMLLVMEAIDQGKIKLSDKVRTSEYAASMGGSQIFLEAGEEMSVEDLLKGVAMASGNDASVALAEHIAGTEQSFVQMMNDRAKELGMNHTNFVNVNGLPAENHYTSAEDIAIMSRELLKHAEITKYTSAYQDYLRKDTDNPFWLVNTNKLVRFYTGADGLKTGYTSEAKFCLSASAVRDNFRIIAVVLGEPNTKTRNAEVSSLFDFAFSQYKSHPLIKQGDKIGTVQVEKGEEAQIELVAKQHYSILMKKGEKTDEIRHELQLDKELRAPIQLGQPIGKLVVYKGESAIKTFEIESPVAIGEANWWTILKRTTSKLFFISK